MTMTGMTTMNLPMLPSTKARGRKAATEVRMVKTTGLATSRVPSTAAGTRPFPRSRWEKMFSPTTTASSTTMPRARMKAKRESMLIDTSKGSISRKLPRKEMGIPSITQKARRRSRNRLRQTKTSTRPTWALRSSRSSRLRSSRASSRT